MGFITLLILSPDLSLKLNSCPTVSITKNNNKISTVYKGNTNKRSKFRLCLYHLIL